MSHDEMRKVFIHSPQPNSIKFCTNSIKTAKYNILTFLPVALIYQFNNYFNIFFLFTAIILSIKVISPLDPGTAIGPFVFVIMTGVIIEGVEDLVSLGY